jgi:hypothetical protein
MSFPGSSTKHQERLRNKGFDIKNAQMEQVVNSVSIKRNVCNLKGEEVCCKTLKTVDKGEDFLSPGSPVFATKISESGHPELYRHRLGVQEEVFAGIKHFGSDRNEAREMVCTLLTIGLILTGYATLSMLTCPPPRTWNLT